LVSRFPSLEQRLMDEAWTGKEGLFEALAWFARELPHFEELPRSMLN
jgi:hypothetical protein